MRGSKELHDVHEDKNISLLFSREEMEKMSSAGITRESFYLYSERGIDMRKCSTCPIWAHLRTLNNTYEMISCHPCIKDTKEA